MRIIAGQLSGRVFESPKTSKTHPMSDRTRGGLFNTLGDISGLTMLDAFAGSGAIGFEALSRGADTITAIESDKAAQRSISLAVQQLGVGKYYRLISTTVSAWMTTSPDTVTFDIVCCDPPYHDLQLPAIIKLSERVKRQGLLVLSWPGKDEMPSLQGFEVIKQKTYGDSQLLFYRRSDTTMD